MDICARCGEPCDEAHNVKVDGQPVVWCERCVNSEDAAMVSCAVCGTWFGGRSGEACDDVCADQIEVEDRGVSWVDFIPERI